MFIGQFRDSLISMKQVLKQFVTVFFSNEAREQKNGFILEYTIFITMFKKLFVSTISTVTVVLFKERKKLYSLGGVYSRLYSKRREGGQTE